MTFAEFHHPSTGWNGTDFSGPVVPIPACGSDSVLVLDGRLRSSAHASLAREACAKRGYVGFSLHAGRSFSDSRETRPFESVEPAPGSPKR